MIYINLSNLDESNLYDKTLQAIEDICQQYALENEFGILSMANQEVVDFMLGWSDKFLLDVDFYLNNHQLDIVYRLPNLPAEALNQHLGKCEDSAVKLLTNNFEYNSENKCFTLTFHVKPTLRIMRGQKYSIFTSQKHLL